VLPELPGAAGGLVHVEDVVAGRARVGPRVLVVDADGHLRGCGTADLLASQGRRGAIAAETLHAGQNIDMKTLHPPPPPAAARAPSRAGRAPGSRDGRAAGRSSPPSPPAPPGTSPPTPWCGRAPALPRPRSSSRSARPGSRSTRSETAWRPGGWSTRCTR